MKHPNFTFQNRDKTRKTGYVPSCPSYPSPQHVGQVCEQGPGVQFQEGNSSITVNYLLTSSTFNSLMVSVSVFNIMVGEADSSSESRISMTSESASRGLFAGMVTLASVRFFFCVLLPFVGTFSVLESSEISMTVVGGLVGHRWEISGRRDGFLLEFPELMLL